MVNYRKYKFNPETLSFELYRIPIEIKFSKGFVLFLLSIVVAVGYFYIYAEYFKMENPKTLSLKRKNEELANRLDLVNRRFENVEQTLSSLQMRDNYVYRPIFGMDEISQEVRDAGFGGVERYAHLDNFAHSDILSRTARNLDILYKKVFVQSKSFDDIATLAKSAGELALSIPTIPPVDITSGRVHFSSGFGSRPDPFTGEIENHKGLDLAGPQGELIYATANGRVVEVVHGYSGFGHYVLIDHGFGISTRYAHLKSTSVTVGMEVERGQSVGLMGSTGKSKGTHLHYEVLLRGTPVNPYNYFNRDISSEEFWALITSGG